jgi:hypothetical protein
LRDVIDKLFGPLGGLPKDVRKSLDDYDKKNDADTTDFAWLNRISRKFLDTALASKANLWIAMDNLGQQDDAFLLPQEIKLFFDKLVLEMSSLTYLDNIRLMLMDYPIGATPPGWEQILWLEDRIAQNDVEETHVLEAINAWCRINTKDPHVDERREKAKMIVAQAEAAVANASKKEPVYRVEMIDKYLKEYLETL